MKGWEVRSVPIHHVGREAVLYLDNGETVGDVADTLDKNIVENECRE